MIGTTSAYAENTAASFACIMAVWNYLRVRGEYMADQDFQTVGKELPPRTRRILVGAIRTGVTNGTTSAYAENTVDIDAISVLGGNYLRVRGEYSAIIFKQRVSPELPPRTRRIRRGRHLQSLAKGTTSAYAENTPAAGVVYVGVGNYLRVRGEYGLSNNLYSTPLELPPRTRRIP